MKNELVSGRRGVLESILERPSVRERIMKKIDQVSDRLEEVRKREKLDFEIFLGGSYAKGTDIRGSDADIFLLFPHEFDALGILNMLKREFPKGIEEYSDHPYLTLRQKSFAIDIVPGFKASTGSELKTAVDRTPFHVKFVKENFSKHMKNEARLLKQFLKGIGAYGAESSVQGFSGYVAELLIYRYKTFDGVIAMAKGWKIPCLLDKASIDFRGANLVIVDPVDSGRNAAANVSLENLSTLVLASQLFSWEKWMDFFMPSKQNFHLPGDAVVVYMRCGKCNEEILIPNLRRIASVLRGELEAMGFRVTYSSVFVKNGGYIVILPEASGLGEAAMHVGPPVTSPNVVSFLQKWKGGTRFGMPFIVGNRICVLRERVQREIGAAIAEILPKVKTSRDFDTKKTVVISGSDLDSVPVFIKRRFLYPSLGKWISD